MNLFISFLLFVTVVEAAPPRSSQYESRPAGAMPCYIGCWTPCERIQCLNGGYCIPPASSNGIAYCNCPSQYTGYRCEQAAAPDPCVTYQCNHGSCQKDRNNQPYCSCYEGYGGARCDTQIDPCVKTNCNHGRCEIHLTIAVCRCSRGYSGSDCLMPVDPCARVSCNYGTCINEGSSYHCECHRGYEGSTCDRVIDPCTTFVCYNGGRCHVQQNNQPVCQCHTGYRGPNCYEKDADPCVRYDCFGGMCKNDRGVARCMCPVGRAGSHCQEDICTLYPCANNGQCRPEGSSRRCICAHPYHGDDCRDVYQPNPCENVYCAYGQCREGVCECHSGYSGTQCDIAPDPCAQINCNYGRCVEGRCSCQHGYTGPYCDIQIITTTLPPSPTFASTNPVSPLSPIPRGPAALKSGELIDYGRLLSPRAGPIGAILALVSGLLLLPLALAFAARQCTQGACVPTKAKSDYIPVQTGITGATQTEARHDNIQVIDQRDDRLAASANETETTRFEQIREIVREYTGTENNAAHSSSAAIFSIYPTMSSHHEDFMREAHQQQSTSVVRPQQRFIEKDYCPPPVADFGYGGVVEGFRDTFETWESTGIGGVTLNTMFDDGGLQTDYELSNINSVSMTPNGKYCIVGQSQGPPQIWDVINGQLVSSMQGIRVNCGKVVLACNGTLLVGLVDAGMDDGSGFLQMWDVNTGQPIQLTHQIRCTTFTVSNDSNNLVMAGNQKIGRGISVGVLDLQHVELAREIKSDTNQPFRGSPSFITLTPDERFAIVGCASAGSTTYAVFDLRSPHDLVQPLTINMDCEPNCSLVLNNEEIVSGTRNGQLLLWNIPTCQRLYALNDNAQAPHRDRITDLKLSPEKSSFVSASADGTAKIWDSNTKNVISRLIGHTREITCVCISTNQLVATGSTDQNICLWRLQSGQLASTMPVGMTPLDIHMAAHNRTVVAIGEKDGERQLLMLRVVSIQR